MIQKISAAKRFRGNPRIPGDKSISHRGLIFGALASGTTEVFDILESGDVQSTARCLRDLGVEISKSGNKTLVRGIGEKGFTVPQRILDCGNSGTTIRLLMGVLAGKGVTATMTGDASLVKRPMKRVAEPLKLMGAQFELTNNDYAPLTVKGAKLHGIDYDLKIASAQIKSAILLAGLSAEGATTIRGEIQSRDHTERFLRYFGAHIETAPDHVRVIGGRPGDQKMKGGIVQVPGDPSTAAFWMAAAALIPGGEIEMEKIALNPTRIGFVHVLERMGAEISTDVRSENPEPVGVVRVRHGKLRGTKVSRGEIPSLIDEVTLLAILATQAHGVTEVEGAEELRVKESDRLEAVAAGLRAMGAEIEVRKDGFRIEGPQTLRGASVQSVHDHRIAMGFSVAGLVAQGETTIHDAECVGISYPDFYSTLFDLAELIR